MDLGFPEITDSFLKGQNIVYTQFNDVEFYVEDIEQENFYFSTLKNLFPNIKFDKIFPLGGKGNVLKDAANNIGDKKKVYIVDLDFDEILGTKSVDNNVFYLERYSIENYLIEFDAIKEVIIEHRPKLKQHEILTTFNINTFLTECHSLFPDLICYYLTIQKYELGITNVEHDTARFCDFTTAPPSIKAIQFGNYHTQVEAALKIKKPKLKLSTQLKYFKKHFKNLALSLKHIPGKYLLNILKYRIEHLFSLQQMTLESFTFRLSKKCEFKDLLFLRQQVADYIE